MKKILSLFCLSFSAKKAGPKNLTTNFSVSSSAFYSSCKKACEKYKILSSLATTFSSLSRVFYHHSRHKKKENTPKERERERAQQMRGKGGRALPLAINKVVFPRRRLKKNKALCVYIIL